MVKIRDVKQLKNLKMDELKSAVFDDRSMECDEKINGRIRSIMQKINMRGRI